MEKLKIKEAIVVEGRDDIDAVGKACDTLLIATHGFGITAETWKLIEKAYDEKGIIILTDPDYSGEEIRRKLTERFPNALQAYISRDSATKAGDIGVENAEPPVIREAIERARPEVRAEGTMIRREDLVRLGLSGMNGSAELRFRVMDMIGIGYGNTGNMIKKLNSFNIGIEELERVVEKAVNEQR